MTVDHSRWPFKNITYQAFGFMTAAEGFVFLSGLVAGFVYAKHVIRDRNQLAKRALKRAWVIYAHHVALLVVCILIENRSPADHYSRSPAMTDQPSPGGPAVARGASGAAAEPTCRPMPLSGGPSPPRPTTPGPSVPWSGATTSSPPSSTRKKAKPTACGF